VSVLETVDALAGGPVLVFGRPPPEGRDLDLLARPAEEKALAEGLLARGFTREGNRFVAFHGCSADVVELVPAADWGLPAAELDALIAAARPLDERTRLLQPAPAHALLILARKAAWSGLDPRARDRLESILREQPGALEEARRLAPAWGAVPGLEALEYALRSGRPPSLARRARAVESLLRARGEPAARARLAGLRAVARRPRRGTLITLSGLDGAGKSSQAQALRATLERLGHDAVVEWTSLSQHPPLLHAITRAAGWVLGRGGDSGASGSEDPRKELRERSRAVTFAWSTLVALTNAVGQARAAGRHLWRGRVVICDRYTLDSKIHLRYAYGEERAFRFQTILIRFLSPRPERAYLLDVSPETATRRKQDYPLVENARRARLYREEAERLGVQRLDGERPHEAICEELSRDVWELLRR
jgi:thymidylate kinase